jgi:hypothetical protein
MISKDKCLKLRLKFRISTYIFVKNLGRMKKYALGLMILAGSLTTYLSYQYSQSENSKRKNFYDKGKIEKATPYNLTSLEGNNNDDNYFEEKKVIQAEKRIKEKYNQLIVNKGNDKQKLERSTHQNLQNDVVKNTSTNEKVHNSLNVNKLKYDSFDKLKDAMKLSVLMYCKIYGISRNALSNFIVKNISELKIIENPLVPNLSADNLMEKQKFILNNLSENYIIGKKGTLIIFPPNAFINSKGMIENENIEIDLQEYYAPTEMLLSGFYTQNKTEIFETEGIINIKAYKNGEEIQINPTKKIFICFRTENEDVNYYLFKQNLNYEWQQVAEQDKNLIPLPLDYLNLHNSFGNTYDKSVIASRAFAKRFEYYSTHVPSLKKAISGIYLGMINEPLYKSDEAVLQYLKDIKADKKVIEQFEKFANEKQGQIVNFYNVHYSPEISLTEQFEQLEIPKSEAERLAQYYLVRKAVQEWNRNHPNDYAFANKIYKVSKLGTFASMKFKHSTNQYILVNWNNINGVDLSKSAVFYISNQSITKVATDNENNLYVPSFTLNHGNIVILNNVNDDNYLAIYEVCNKNNIIKLNQNVEYQKVNSEELENRLSYLFH